MAFRKKSVDTYDYTLLQKKGLMEKPEEKKMMAKIDSKGYFDFSVSQMNSSQSIQPVQQPQTETNPLSFFDGFAAASAQQEPQGLPPPPTHEPTEIVDLKVKLENIEYKLERFAEKLAFIESKLDESGNKI